MSADLEARLLASLPNIEAFAALRGQGIGVESFMHWRSLYTYIDELVREHQHLPRLRDLKATFNLPDHIKRQPEEYDWLLLEFQRLTLAQQVQDVLDRTIETHGEDPAALIPNLVRELTALGGTLARATSYTDGRSIARLDEYAALAPQGGEGGMMHGIPTGYSYFDATAQLGWLPGELIGIVARLYMGKSWLLIWHGVLAWLAGRRVLLLSPEMTRDEAEARFDAVLCGQRGVPVSVTELYRGYQPTAPQRALFAEVARRNDWITLTTEGGRPFSLSELPRAIRTHAPDLVLIDGLPLIRGEGGRGQQVWEQIKDLSYGLKDVATSAAVPIIVTHQANRAAKDTGKPPGLHEIGMGDAFAQACDKVLVMSTMAHEPDARRVTIQKFRKGRPLVGGIRLYFDPEHGLLHEVTDELPGRADGAGHIRDIDAPGERDEASVLIP